MAQRQDIYSAVERVIDVDPTAVWSLVANPERLGTWAGVTMVGYMGTELPKPGHNVFIRSGLMAGRSRPKRMEIEVWDAGAGISCVVHTEPESTHFDLTIRPEVEPGRISTRVRLVQRSSVPAIARGVAAWWVERRLNRMIDRIDKAVR